MSEAGSVENRSGETGAGEVGLGQDSEPLVSPAVEEKRVSWAELFFDLVFVFAITQLSTLLHADHSWAGIGRTLVVFVPIYWAWVAMSVHANTRDVENPVDRLGIFTVALASLYMALAVPAVFSGQAVFFAAAYLGARIVLLALVLRSRGLFVNPFSLAVFVTGPLRLLGAFLSPAWLVALWSVAAAVDVAAPAAARRLVVARIRYHPLHLPERFGLFLIIALGESIVAIGAPASATGGFAAPTVLAVAVAFGLACGLWWVYFIFSASAIQHSVAIGRVPADVIRSVLSYGHFALIGSIVAIAVGLRDVVGEPTHPSGVASVGLLCGGLALYLGTLGVLRIRMGQGRSTGRLVAAAVALVPLPFAQVLPAVAVLCGLTVLVAVVAAGEHLLHRHRIAGS
jgi:low temperature requirement protein LtrA